MEMAVWEFSQHFCDYSSTTRDETKTPTEFPCTLCNLEIGAIDKAVAKPRWHIVECGGKRSATPLWLRVMLADGSEDHCCLRKRRRASLAAAPQGDFANSWLRCRMTREIGRAS